MKTKRILSLLVVMAMLFSCVGITAFAEEVDTWDQLYDAIENGDGNITLGDDVIIGEKSVATYEDLVAALESGEAVKLTADIVAPDKAVLIINNQVVNLGGHSLTLNGESGKITNGEIKNGKIIITTYEGDTVADGMFDVCGTESKVTDVEFYSEKSAIYALFDLKEGDLTFDSCKINMTDNDSAGGLFYFNGGNKLTMSSTTVDGTNIGDFISNGTVELNDCIINLKGTVAGGLDNGINGAALTLNDTNITIDGATGRGITTDGDDIAVNGTSSVNLTNCAEGGIRFKASAKITVAETASLSGTVKVDSAATDAKINDTTVSVTGEELPTATVKNGVTTVGTEKTAVAKIDDTPYDSLDAAYAAAVVGDTITLFDDVKISTKFTVNKAITLDGNGHSIIADDTAVWYTVSGKLNIKNYNTHLISVNADNVTLKNIVLDNNSNAAGINVYCSQNVVFDNVSIINATKGMAALTVNGSTLTFKNKFETLGNSIAIDISNGSGVTSNLGVTVEEGTVFNLADKTVKFASVAVNDVSGAVNADGEAYFVAMDSGYYYTENQINSRTTAFSNGITLLDDIELTKEISIKSKLVLNGNTLTIPEDKALKIIGNTTIKTAGGTINGKLNITSVDTTITAEEGLAVVTTVEGYKVVYSEGKYSLSPIVYVPALAKIGDTEYAAVAEALEAAKAAGMTDVTITLVGETTKDSAVSLDDAFNLYTVNVFDNVTFKQENSSVPYYIAGIYTGSRTNGGEFIFDGVNIIVTDQYILEGNVRLTNNSVIKSVTEANCFFYANNTTIESGSKIYGVIEDFRDGNVVVEGGRTDGGYNQTPDMQDAIMVINWSGDSLTLKNGAYLKINSANEVGRLTINAGASLNVNASKAETCEYIVNNGTINIDVNSLINTKKITGTGKIVIDASAFDSKDVVLINADMSGFTGEIKVINNSNAKYEIAEDKLILTYVPEPPTATVTKHYENKDLAFALNFKADEVTAEQLAYYGDWYADFVLTVNKKVTFNANGEADGYLCGQYDEWSENWVYVPFEDVTLEANTSLKIMEYAAELMGQPGLKYTYAEVYEVVNDFNCGVFFDEDFLAANQDLKVTLELRMYNPKNESESYAIGDTKEFDAEDFEIPEIPTATVTEVENEDLAFALNFKADEVTEKQLAYYGDWYADFVLTVNKDVIFNANGGANGYLSGQYDAWSENWVNVPFENVTVSADQPLKIMEYAAELMGSPGLKYTYAEVYEFVKEFNCGVFFEEDYLAANPDLQVTLELRMYNPKDESESYAIGETYTFTLEVEEEEPYIFGKAFYMVDLPKINDMYQVGLYAGIDSLKYREVGFKIYNQDDVLIGQSSTNTVYTSVKGNNMTVTADWMNSFRIFGVTAQFGNTWDNIPVFFRPYATDLRGKEILGFKYKIEDIYPATSVTE